MFTFSRLSIFLCLVFFLTCSFLHERPAHLNSLSHPQNLSVLFIRLPPNQPTTHLPSRSESFYLTKIPLSPLFSLSHSPSLPLTSRIPLVSLSPRSFMYMQTSRQASAAVLSDLGGDRWRGETERGRDEERGQRGRGRLIKRERDDDKVSEG